MENAQVACLKAAILTIGRTLPMGMEVLFSRDDGDPRVRMNIVEPNGNNTEYAFLKSNPLLAFPLDSLLRERLLEDVLRDLLATIELHTDCMDGRIDSEPLAPYMEKAERLLAEGWEPDPGHPANRVSFVPASVSYPTGSLGESVGG